MSRKPPQKKFQKKNESSSRQSRPKEKFEKKEKEETLIKADQDVRLNRYIANAGICSRREADKLIADGRIKVNGKVVKELGIKVTKSDKVHYNGRLLNPEKPVYVLLNKPKDFITTVDDPKNRKTVMKLVEKACEERIYPVGRLDRQTTGLLLFTNDGELAKRMMHPSHKIRKIYQATINKSMTMEHFEQIQEGLQLDDGPVNVDQIAILDEENTMLGIELHVGRNRIVRRIFEHLGYDVIKLDRVVFGPLTKKDLPRGKFRHLNSREVQNLKNMLRIS